MTFTVVNMVVGARQHKLIHWDFHSDKTISMVGTDDGPKKERLSTVFFFFFKREVVFL